MSGIGLGEQGPRCKILDNKVWEYQILGSIVWGLL